MIIPLGLGGKLPRFPWITATITVVLVLSFIAKLNKSHQVEDEITRTINQSKLAAVTYELFSEFCSIHQISKTACHKEATRLGNRFYFDKTKISKERGKLSLNEESKVAKVSKLFVSFLDSDSNRLSNLREFQTYIKLKSKLQTQLAAFYKREGLYSANNRGLKALLNAQLSHSGIMHLLSNLLVLIVFGVYLEMRLDPVVFLTCYFLGGMVGLPTFFLFNPESNAHLVGASANIAAIMGAFFAVFYRFRLLMGVFWLFSVRRKFLMQVSVVIPLLFILKDAVGVGSESGFFGGVAHSAHLGGLLVGLVVGGLELFISPIQWPFRNHLEFEQIRDLKQLASVKSQSVVAHELLQQNPDNLYAHLTVLNSSLTQNGEFDPLSWISIWRTHLPDLMSICLRSGKSGIVIRLFERVPLSLRLTEVLVTFNRLSLLQIADAAFDRQQFPVAIRLYDAFIELNPASPILPTLKETLRELAWVAKEDEQMLRFISEYQTHNSRSEFCKFLSSSREENPNKNYGTYT